MFFSWLSLNTNDTHVEVLELLEGIYNTEYLKFVLVLHFISFFFSNCLRPFEQGKHDSEITDH